MRLSWWVVLRWLIAFGWVGTVSTYALSTFWPLVRAHPTTQSVWQRDQLPVAVMAAGVILALLVLRWRWRRSVRWALVALAVLLPLLLAAPSQQMKGVWVVFYLCLLAWLLGLVILRLVGATDAEPGAQLVLPVVLGLGTLALLVLAAGVAGVMSRPVVWGGSVLLALGSVAMTWRSIAGWAKQTTSLLNDAAPPSWFTVGCLIVLGLFYAMNLFFALAPEITSDALTAHLALAKIYSTEHRISGLSYSIVSYWPIGGDLLLTIGYQLGGETTAKLTHLLAGVLAAASVYLLGKRLHSVETGIAAATMIYTVPIFAWLSGTAYIDLFLTMYAGVALVFLCRWLDQRDWASVGCLGLSLGFALGTKMTGGFLALGAGLAMLGVVIFAGRGARLRAFAALSAVTVITAVTGGVWYLRTWWITGNPVFPFFNNIFRSPLWNPVNERGNLGMFGIGLTPEALLKLPWAMTFRTSRFGEHPDGLFGLTVLLFVPLLFLFVKLKLHLRVLLVVGIIFYLSWFLNVQYLRYLLPLSPVIALLAGWAVVAFWQDLAGRNRALAATIPAVFLGLSLFHLALTLTNSYSLIIAKPTDVVLGRITREKYQELLPAARTFTYANAHLPAKSTRIYAVAEANQYLSDAPMHSQNSGLIGGRILHSKTKEELLELLARAGITHLVINQNNLPPHWTFIVHSPDFLAEHARLLYTHSNVALYRLLNDKTEKGDCNEEVWQDLLKDPGFEGEKEQAAEIWTKFGDSAIVSAPLAIAGRKSAKVEKGNGFIQRVAAEEGKLYALSVLVKSQRSEPSQPTLQIVWHDANGKPLEWSIAVPTAGPTAQRLSSNAIAPPGTKMAAVYLAVYSGAVIFDDVAFRVRTDDRPCP